MIFHMNVRAIKGWFLTWEKITGSCVSSYLGRKKIPDRGKKIRHSFSLRRNSPVYCSWHLLDINTANCILEWLSTECRETKTRVITLANQLRTQKMQSTNQTHCWREARENVCERIVIGFGFISEKRWREFFKPIM